MAPTFAGGDIGQNQVSWHVSLQEQLILEADVLDHG
jgi:hypothetical protein